MQSPAHKRLNRHATKRARLRRRSTRISCARILRSNRRKCHAVKSAAYPRARTGCGTWRLSGWARTITLPDPPPASRNQLYPGGNEGDPSLPRGDKRRAGNAPQFMQAFVLGTDSRVLQTPTTSFPFRGVVKLMVKFPNTPAGKAVGCTGSLIG